MGNQSSNSAGEGSGHHNHDPYIPTYAAKPHVGLRAPHAPQAQHGQRQSSGIRRSPSDQPMEEATAQKSEERSASQKAVDAHAPPIEVDTVPTVFTWEHGGREVYITGTFNGWSRQIPMHRSGNDFTYIHELERGMHAFKFIVDDEWRFAADKEKVTDRDGRINNFIDVTDFEPYRGDRDFGEEAAGEAPEETGFSQNMPDLDEYTKEPPPLPPHLRHIILNKPPQLQDTAALPVPQHVALNHLYCTAIKDNMMVLGITQRYKTKFVTTVFYSPCSPRK